MICAREMDIGKRGRVRYFVVIGVILLKNYFGGYWPWRIAASLKSDSFDSALLAIDSSKTAFSFKHFYPPTDGPQPD
jgi:hypothetical protein